MSLTFEKLIAAAAGRPEQPLEESQSSLSVVVVFTSVETTVQALRKAGVLASRLNARITLLVPQIVPYPRPITNPPVLVDFNEKRFRVIAGESRVETTVHIYLCRDRREALVKVLEPHSLVVIGDRKQWWRTAERRLAKQLRRAGHEVMMVETE